MAEVYGPDYQQQMELARQIKKVFETTPGVVDVDWYVEDPQAKYDVVVDLDKAALHGVSAAAVTQTMQIGSERRDGRTAARSASRARTCRFACNSTGRGAPAIESLATDEIAEPRQSHSRPKVSMGPRFDAMSRERDHRREPLRQEPAAGGVRAGRCGGRGREPGVRHHEDERGHRQAEDAAGLRASSATTRRCRPRPTG